MMKDDMCTGERLQEKSHKSEEIFWVQVPVNMFTVPWKLMTAEEDRWDQHGSSLYWELIVIGGFSVTEDKTSSLI